MLRYLNKRFTFSNGPIPEFAGDWAVGAVNDEDISAVGCDLREIRKMLKQITTRNDSVFQIFQGG